MPLTEPEKVKIRHHMGYLNMADAYTFVLGVPASVETQFMIEGAMIRVLESALPELRRLVGILDSIEEQMVGDLELAAVNRLDSIEVNQNEQRQLTERYDYWVAALGNLLGLTRNPFDQRKKAGRVMNVPVAH